MDLIHCTEPDFSKVGCEFTNDRSLTVRQGSRAGPRPDALLHLGLGGAARGGAAVVFPGPLDLVVGVLGGVDDRGAGAKAAPRAGLAEDLGLDPCPDVLGMRRIGGPGLPPPAPPVCPRPPA